MEFSQHLGGFSSSFFRFLLHISQKQKLIVLVVLIWAYFPNKSRVILVINHYASVFCFFSSSKIVHSPFCFNTCDVVNVDIFLFIIDVWTSLCQTMLPEMSVWQQIKI